MTHRLLVRVVLVVVGEQVDAEADAPGHGEEGDAPPLLHVSCAVAGGREDGSGQSRACGVPLSLYGRPVSVGQRNIDGASWGSRATGDGDGIVHSATAASRIEAVTTRTKSRGTRASNSGTVRA